MKTASRAQHGRDSAGGEGGEGGEGGGGRPPSLVQMKRNNYSYSSFLFPPTVIRPLALPPPPPPPLPPAPSPQTLCRQQYFSSGSPPSPVGKVSK
ncbi:unnamed protein product [Merluccius merluccius]